MKSLIVSIAFAGAMLGSAVANDTMDAMIGAAVVYAYVDGTAVAAKYSADGTYTTDVAGGGKWSMNGDELCITTDSGEKGCTQLSPGKAKGDSWEAKDAFGNAVTVTIK